MAHERQPQQSPPARAPTPPTPEATALPPAIEAVAPAAVARRLAAPGALDRPTARALRRADVLRAQGAVGNRRVARLLAQRQDPDPAPAGSGGPPPATAPATGLIVDDAAAPLPHQLRKGDFLQQLRATVAAAAGQALA